VTCGQQQFGRTMQLLCQPFKTSSLQPECVTEACLPAAMQSASLCVPSIYHRLLSNTSTKFVIVIDDASAKDDALSKVGRHTSAPSC
jgi:hypothetical protein